MSRRDPDRAVDSVNPESFRLKLSISARFRANSLCFDPPTETVATHVGPDGAGGAGGPSGADEPADAAGGGQAGRRGAVVPGRAAGGLRAAAAPAPAAGRPVEQRHLRAPRRRA